MPDRPSYDYLLVLGPGRSGSTFLHEILKSHGGFAAPEIKEGYYYRSFRRFEKALRRVRGAAAPAILVDVANLAYRDPSLAAGIEILANRGYRVLLVVLLRSHRARATSMTRHRRSRGELSALLGARALERTVVRDSLTPEDLSRIHDLPVDVLTVGFSALTGNTGRFLEILAGLCGTARFEAVLCRPVNESVRARSVLLSAAGKLAATALRRAGFLTLLQRLKDNPRVRNVFLVPLAAGQGQIRFGDRTECLLASRFEACRRVMVESSERLAEDVWLKRADADGPARRSRQRTPPSRRSDR